MWGMRILKRIKWMDLGNEDVEEFKNKDAKDKVEMGDKKDVGVEAMKERGERRALGVDYGGHGDDNQWHRNYGYIFEVARAM